jgi:hypothetical protein
MVGPQALAQGIAARPSSRSSPTFCLHAQAFLVLLFSGGPHGRSHCTGRPHASAVLSRLPQRQSHPPIFPFCPWVAYTTVLQAPQRARAYHPAYQPQPPEQRAGECKTGHSMPRGSTSRRHKAGNYLHRKQQGCPPCSIQAMVCGAAPAHCLAMRTALHSTGSTETPNVLDQQRSPSGPCALAFWANSECNGSISGALTPRQGLAGWH